MHIRGWKIPLLQLLAAAILLIVSVAVPALMKDPESGVPEPSSTGQSKTYTGSGPSPTIRKQDRGPDADAKFGPTVDSMEPQHPCPLEGPAAPGGIGPFLLPDCSDADHAPPRPGRSLSLTSTSRGSLP
ncbi:MAG: hypothetical protein ACR2QO_11750 [Acidimicrobiales bacterium]